MYLLHWIRSSQLWNHGILQPSVLPSACICYVNTSMKTQISKCCLPVKFPTNCSATSIQTLPRMQKAFRRKLKREYVNCTCMMYCVLTAAFLPTPWKEEYHLVILPLSDMSCPLIRIWRWTITIWVNICSDTLLKKIICFRIPFCSEIRLPSQMQ